MVLNDKWSGSHIPVSRGPRGHSGPVDILLRGMGDCSKWGSAVIPSWLSHHLKRVSLRFVFLSGPWDIYLRTQCRHASFVTWFVTCIDSEPAMTPSFWGYVLCMRPARGIDPCPRTLPGLMRICASFRWNVLYRLLYCNLYVVFLFWREIKNLLACLCSCWLLDSCYS